MAKLAITLSVLALSALAACSTYDYDRSYTTTPPQPDARPSASPIYPVASYRSGYGVIEAIVLERYAGPTSPSAGAGATVGHAIDRTAYRLTVRMEDGGVQSIAQDNRDFRVGDRVQLTHDGRVIRL